MHREARETWDESADLTTLSSTHIGVVCAGVKSILDVGATLERLETLNVTVVGYQTTRFPGFYLTDSGFGLDWSVDSPKAAARVINAHVSDGAIVIANPVATDVQLDPALHARVLNDGLLELQRQGIRGVRWRRPAARNVPAARAARSAARASPSPFIACFCSQSFHVRRR